MSRRNPEEAPPSSSFEGLSDLSFLVEICFSSKWVLKREETWRAFSFIVNMIVLKAMLNCTIFCGQILKKKHSRVAFEAVDAFLAPVQIAGFFLA